MAEWEQVAQQVEQAARGREGTTLAGENLNWLLDALPVSLLPLPPLGRGALVPSRELLRLASCSGIMALPSRDTVCAETGPARVFARPLF